MIIKEYEDGSQFTEKHVAFVLASSAVIAAVGITIDTKLQKWKTKRSMKKHGWTQESIDRV